MLHRRARKVTDPLAQLPDHPFQESANTIWTTACPEGKGMQSRHLIHIVERKWLFLSDVSRHIKLTAAVSAGSKENSYLLTVVK